MKKLLLLFVLLFTSSAYAADYPVYDVIGSGRNTRGFVYTNTYGPSTGPSGNQIIQTGPNSFSIDGRNYNQYSNVIEPDGPGGKRYIINGNLVQEY
ncbi:MAG: hypothetical protein E7Z87_08245 [Cyanobacteria bacterium SIG26]|nr:hypothetical protein [Cyanobacteria bacterium SIG26]